MKVLGQGLLLWWLVSPGLVGDQGLRLRLSGLETLDELCIITVEESSSVLFHEQLGVVSHGLLDLRLGESSCLLPVLLDG